MQAKKFKVRIMREQKVQVDLTFPIFTLSLIDTLIPEKAMDYLKHSEIDLKQILAKVEASQYAPQSILEFSHEGRDFHLWIE
jgi:hypothetical protein